MKALYWIISAAVTVAGLGFMGAGAANMSKEKGEDITKTFTDTKDIQVSLGDTRLTIVPDEKAEAVTVDLHNVKKGTTVDQQNGKLIIQQKNNTHIQFFQTEKQESTATITVPAGIELGELALDLGSADNSSVSGLTMQQYSLDLGSGSLTFTGCEIAQNAVVDIGSGKYTMEDITVGGNTEFRGGSGKIALTDIQTKDFQYQGGSGSLELRQLDAAGRFAMEVASGSVSGNDVTVGGVTNLELASGIWNIAHFTPGSETMVKVASGNFMMGLTGAQEDYSFNSKNASGITVIGEQSGKGLIMNGGDKHITSEGASGRIEFYFGDEPKTIQGGADFDDEDLDLDDIDVDIDD